MSPIDQLNTFDEVDGIPTTIFGNACSIVDTAQLVSNDDCCPTPITNQCMVAYATSFHFATFFFHKDATRMSLFVFDDGLLKDERKLI